MSTHKQKEAIDTRNKTFVQLLGTQKDSGMTRIYMAMKGSEMLNRKR